MGRPCPPEFREEVVRVTGRPPCIEVCEDGERFDHPAACLCSLIRTLDPGRTQRRTHGGLGIPWDLPLQSGWIS
jgi:hypothetical protein